MRSTGGNVRPLDVRPHETQFSSLRVDEVCVHIVRGDNGRSPYGRNPTAERDVQSVSTQDIHADREPACKRRKR